MISAVLVAYRLTRATCGVPFDIAGSKSQLWFRLRARKNTVERRQQRTEDRRRTPTPHRLVVSIGGYLGLLWNHLESQLLSPKNKYGLFKH